jgi:hypothetical protein
MPKEEARIILLEQDKHDEEDENDALMARRVMILFVVEFCDIE